MVTYRRTKKKSLQHPPQKNDVNLDGGFNPFKKYARQIGNLPEGGVQIKKKMKPPGSNMC